MDVGLGYGLALLGLGIGVGLLVLGAASGISRLAAAAVEGIARQPEAAASIRGTALVLAALIEGFTFFALIVVILLNPADSVITISKDRADAGGKQPAVSAVVERTH
jgi:F-type H+-transporting ATPase subunit c